MSGPKTLALVAALLSSGCVYVKESSGTATQAEIESRLQAQLHSHELYLTSTGQQGFTGTGKNDTGDFKVEVKRQREKIEFHGNYAPPVYGGFSGSFFWSRSRARFLCFHKLSQSSQSTFTTESPARH